LCRIRAALGVSPRASRAVLLSELKRKARAGKDLYQSKYKEERSEKKKKEGNEI